MADTLRVTREVAGLLKTRDTQTQVKHLVLAGYMTKWSSIIINGLANPAQRAIALGQPFRARFVYVDGFGYKGRYSGNTTDVLLNGTSALPTWGSPIIGIQGLQGAKAHASKKGFNLSTWALIAEDDDFADLVDSLKQAGYGAQTAINAPTIQFRDGVIDAVEGNFLARIGSLMTVLSDRYTYALILLDPYGPKGIPLHVVKRFVSSPRVDVIINFPYQDLHKKLGYVIDNKPLTQGAQATLANYDAMFGTSEWQRIVKRLTATASLDACAEQVETELANLYEQCLRQVDSTVSVKSIRLAFPNQDRTMFYLYLTTHDPTGALTMNEVIHEARASEYALKWDYRQARWIHKQHQGNQMTLFDTAMGVLDAPAFPDRQVDIDALAMEVYRQFRGQTVAVRDVFASLADTDYFVSDVQNALRRLRKSGRVEFKELKVGDVLRFANA